MSNHAVQCDAYLPRVVNPEGDHPALLVCEHASAEMPPEFEGLGLGAVAKSGHIAWDPGALTTAMFLSQNLNAPLVHATASRLLYDCNRPPQAADAIPERSEDTVIPGNIGLSGTAREARVERFYRPFERLLSNTLAKRPNTKALVTIHSFTPIYRGTRRAVEIGILHDSDARLADAMLEVATGYKVARNDPYGPEDGVTHSLKQHALPRSMLNVMIEIRNDLITTPESCSKMAGNVTLWLEAALALLEPTA